MVNCNMKMVYLHPILQRKLLLPIGNSARPIPSLYAFGTENEERTAQDVGFDGLDNVAEATAFNTNFTIQ